MVLGRVADGHRLARGEGLGLELLADPADDILVASSGPGEDVGDDGRADVVIDEPFDVGVVGIADGPVVVDHALGPVGGRVPELVLVEGVGPPFLEQLQGRLARAHRHFGLHEHDLALDVDALVVVVAELGRGDAVADIDDLGRDLARPRRPAGHELVLVRIGLLDDAALPRRDAHLADAAREDDGVGIREELPVGPVVAARLDAPALEQGLDPLDAGFVFLRAGQPAAVFLGDELLDVIGERLALDEMHGLDDLGLVGRGGSRPAGPAGPRAGVPRPRETMRTAGAKRRESFMTDASLKNLKGILRSGAAPSQKPRPAGSPAAFDSAPGFCYFGVFGVFPRRHP